ncbi:hypothetical protein ANANG_G00226940 [Anguilla anguilla]|uniref:FAT domain-containing protein n=1 Tax=Anguilla anguilla TaxID=7936 RepID=A0A9D3RQ86_ANGAN|nr:hypothetical protein ANANG_G00226940 [Anguilla anguilla]
MDEGGDGFTGPEAGACGRDRVLDAQQPHAEHHHPADRADRGGAGREFKLYLPQLIPHMLRVFMHDNSTGRSVTIKLLNAIQLFGANLDDYLHLLLPPIVKLFDAPDVPLQARKVSLETLDRLTESLDFTDYASRIIHPIVRTLDGTPELRTTSMDTLSSLVFQLGKKYQIFIPMVNEPPPPRPMPEAQGYTLAEEEEDPLIFQHRHLRGNQGDALVSGPVESGPMKKLHVSTSALQKIASGGWGGSGGGRPRVTAPVFGPQAWGRPGRCRRTTGWSGCGAERGAAEGVLFPRLRSCWSLAQTYIPLARDLFNAAFLSCWSELSEDQQDELIHSIELALTSQDIAEVTQTLLNLAEFMEHSDKQLQLCVELPRARFWDDNGIVLLGERAAKCRAYAKALHYKELEFQKGPSP